MDTCNAVHRIASHAATATAAVASCCCCCSYHDFDWVMLPLAGKLSNDCPSTSIAVPKYLHGPIEQCVSLQQSCWPLFQIVNSKIFAKSLDTKKVQFGFQVFQDSACCFPDVPILCSKAAQQQTLHKFGRGLCCHLIYLLEIGILHGEGRRRVVVGVAVVAMRCHLGALLVFVRCCPVVD